MSDHSPRWSPQAAWKWYDALPYLVGANFIPSTAINQLEMWQAETFDPHTIDRELSWAAALGMNVMRVYLHDLLWQQDAPAFCSRIDEYLSLARRHSIRTLFTIFDDCWNQHFALGPQPAPKPATHNSGWVQSPGVHVVNNPTDWPRLQRYVTGLLARYRADPRILAWDLYNEPGNGAAGELLPQTDQTRRSSQSLLAAAFAWARSVENLSQPLTVGLWKFTPDFDPINAFSIANSDILSFHNYNPPQNLGDCIRNLQHHGRPLICTEYMCRGLGSTFEFCLPILAKYRVAAINWGLVAGKTQTIFPWGWNPDKGLPDVWFHDIFHPDGSLLYPREAAIFHTLRTKPQR